MRPVLKACVAVLPCLLMAEPAAAQSSLLRDALERATGKAVQEGINKALKTPAPKSSTQAKANTQVSPKRRQAMQDQQALNDLGFDAGPVDGIPGRRTANAVRAFQRANGFPETGTLTNAQRDRLYRRSGGIPAEVLTVIPSIIGTTTDRRRNDAGSNQGTAALTGAGGQSDVLTAPEDRSEAREERVRARQNSIITRENATTSNGIANDKGDRASRRALQAEERRKAIDAFEARETARGGTATATKDRATTSSGSAAKEAAAAAAETRGELRCRLRAGDDAACNQ